MYLQRDFVDRNLAVILGKTMKKNFCFFILLFYFVFFSNIFLFSQPSFPGEGTEVEPYELWTKEHLMELCDSINSDYRYLLYPPEGYDNWTTNKHFRLMRDIDSISQSIGGETFKSFKGHFFCNEKKITVAMPDSFVFTTAKNCDQPMIIALDGISTLNGLILDGYVTYGTCPFRVGNYSIVSRCVNNVVFGYGGITYDNYGTISHCINNGNVTGVDRIGGISAELDRGRIVSCINTGKITASNSGDNSIGSGVGGIVGASPNSLMDISYCINIGDVIGRDYVGGIIGSARGLASCPITIMDCMNSSSVGGKNVVGGIIGMIFNERNDIRNCINAGIIEGEEDVGNMLGKEE